MGQIIIWTAVGYFLTTLAREVNGILEEDA